MSSSSGSEYTYSEYESDKDFSHEEATQRVEKNEHGFPQKLILFHYGINNFQDPIFQDWNSLFWIKVKETAHLSPLTECVQVKPIRDPCAEVAYMDDDRAIYLPPFDKELQGIIRVDYTDENNKEQCSSCKTLQFTQDKTQNIVRDTISNSPLSTQSIDASKNDQIILKTGS